MILSILLISFGELKRLKSCLNKQNVQNKISNTTNNFNDDIRIRNNEPTIKQMQASTIAF